MGGVVFQVFSLDTPVWEAFFRIICSVGIPRQPRQGSRVLCLSFFAHASPNSPLVVERSSEQIQREHGVVTTFPYQQLGFVTPLALAHLWWMTTDLRITYQSLMTNQAFIHLDTDLETIDAIAKVAQINPSDFDFIMTGSTYPGNRIESDEGMGFVARLWDTSTGKLVYERDARKNGYDLRQNMSDLGTEVTNCLFNRGDVLVANDYLESFSFWLEENDLWAFGNITETLCSELAYAMNLIENIPNYDRWPKVLDELARVSQHYHRPEFYKAYFMYLMCRGAMPGLNQEQFEQFQEVVASAPDEMKEELKPYIFSLAEQFERGPRK